MAAFTPNIRSVLSSRATSQKLSEFADRFGLSDQERRLQAKILNKLLNEVINEKDLPRVIRLNLNLSEKDAQVLADLISKSFISKNQSSSQSSSILNQKNPIPSSKSDQDSSRGAETVKILADEVRAWIDKAIDTLNLSLDNLQRSRFESSILTYLKDIRDAIETEGALARSRDNGGVGLDASLASRVVYSLEQEFPDEKRFRIVASQNGNNKIHQDAVNPARVLEQLFIEPDQSFFPNKISKSSINTQSDVSNISPLPLKIQNEKINPPRVFDVKPSQPPLEASLKSAISSLATNLNSNPPANLGIIINQISKVEDLARLNIENFRQTEPKLAVEQILAIIRRLVARNELLRSKSIIAWRASAPYKLYVAMGSESIAKGKTIADIAVSRKAEGKFYLSEVEFNAITDASREFQY